MLNRFSTVLQNAADALAPPAPPLEDLKYHWKLVMRFYAQRSVHSKTPIEQTNIPAHLEQLLKILVSEDASVRSASASGPCTVAGPCLEFLLQHRLMELLASLACADSPPGMKRYLLGYLRRFVSAIAPHLLTHASIHLPLVRIINMCSQSKASPTEAEEIDFLVTLCQLVHSHPYLTLIFNKEVKAERPLSLSSSTSSSCRALNNQHELCQPLANVDLASKQTTSSRTESSCDDVRPQSGSDIQGNDEGIVVDKDKGSTTSSCKDEGKMVPEQSENTTPSLNRNRSDISEDKLSSGGNHSVKTLPSKQLSAESDHRSDQANEDLINQHWPLSGLSQATTRTGTPESFALLDGDEYQEMEPGEGRLPLLDAVLGYINSVDSRTKLRVCEGLLLLVSIADDTFSNAIARTSHLGLAVAEKLSSSFQEIPSEVHPDYLEDLPANWGPETSQLWLDQHTFPGSRIVASFVSWLNFCDQLTSESPTEVADSLACAIRALFFEVELESELRSENCSRKTLITNIISLCLRHLSSPALVSELNCWLVGESREIDAPDVTTSSMKQLMLDHCLQSDNHLSLSTLRLFELLLENCNEHVLHCLVLVYLSGRGYYESCPARDNSHMESWSDEEDAREIERERARESGRERALHHSHETSATSSYPDDSSVSRTFAPSNIHKIIDSFLLLLPSGLRSATDYEQAGYHQYVAEAQRQYTLNRQHCAQFGWPLEASFPDDTGKSSDSRPEDDHCFNEGPFLRMIFTRLRALAQQPYEVNLQLTALVSRLAMLPHPHLHEYLLNPLVPLVPGSTSLYSTLQAVAGELQANVATLPHCKKMLVKTRQQLLGDPHYSEQSFESSCLFESVVVLEEFCKELAAIAFVKYHHSS